MTDLEKRVNEALERLAAKHAPTAPQPQPPQDNGRKVKPFRLTSEDAPAPRPRPAARPAAPKVWGGSREGRDLEGRFADAPDATRPGELVAVFVFEVEPVNGEPYATCVRQDNRQRIRLPIAALVKVRDNA